MKQIVRSRAGYDRIGEGSGGAARTASGRGSFADLTVDPAARRVSLGHALGSRIWGGETIFCPRKSSSSFFLLKWGVQIMCLFSQNQTPRSDSVNFVSSEPIFCPQILEPRLEVDGNFSKFIGCDAMGPNQSMDCHCGGGGNESYKHNARCAAGVGRRNPGPQNLGFENASLPQNLGHSKNVSASCRLVGMCAHTPESARL